MNITGEIVDIFNLTKSDIKSEVIILGACRINRCATCQIVKSYLVIGHKTDNKLIT